MSLEAKLCFLTLFLVIGNEPAESAMRFTEKPPSTISRRKGENITLEWDYEIDNRDQELLVIHWTVKEKSTGKTLPMIAEWPNGTRLVASTIPAAYKGRVYVKGEASLVVENLTLEDATTFGCRLVSKGGAIEFSPVELTVTDPPKASTDNQIVTSEKGGAAKFICNATGVPSPDFTWIRKEESNVTVIVHNGVKYEITSISATSSQLTVRNCSIKDYGLYECKATGDGFDLVQYFLGVPFFMPLVPSRTVTIVRTSIGEPFVLACPVRGFPPPEITWTLSNGTVLQNRLTTTLSVDADLGNYTCSAKSLDKEVSEHTFKIQRDVIVSVTTLDSTIESGAPAVVKWSEVSGAVYYFLEITGEDIEDNTLFGSAENRSVEIHFHELVSKDDKKRKEVQIEVEVKAMSAEYRLIARGDRVQTTVSWAVTVNAGMLPLFVGVIHLASWS